MNLRIDATLLKRLITITAIFIVIKAAMLILSYLFLPTEGINSVPLERDHFYYKYRIARAMGIEATKVAPKKAQNQVASGPLNEMHFNGTLKAIYATAINPFIAVESAGKVKLLSINDTLEGYTLKEIHPEYATFIKGGAKFALRFKANKNGAKMSYSKAEDEEIPDIDAPVYVKRKEIHYYAKNLKQIWKNIKIKELVSKDRKLQGFKVTWIKKGSIFDKIGLKKDDVILGVNNKQFKSISQVFKIYNNIQKMDNLKLTIRRGSEQMELEYEIL